MSKTRLAALDQPTRPIVPELGRIRLGDEKIDPKKPGKPLPYFRVDFNATYKHLERYWNELYPEPPAALDNIFMAHRNADDAFTSSMEEWTAARVLNRRCDGHTIHQWHNPTTQKYEFTPKQCQCNAQKPTCRLVGRLSFVVKDFYEYCERRGVKALGYFLMATSSRHNITRIDSLLQGIQAQYGQVQGIPFLLERTSEEVSTPIPADAKTGKPATRILKTHYFISLRTADAFTPFAAEALLTVGAKPVALTAGTPPPVAALPAPAQDVIDVDDIAFDDEPTKLAVDLTAVTVALDSRNVRYLRFTASNGYTAYRRSRDVFVNAGWIAQDGWKDVGDYTLPKPIPAMIEKDEDGYWQVIEVALPE